MAEKEIHKLDSSKLQKFTSFEVEEQRKSQDAQHALEENKRKAEVTLIFTCITFSNLANVLLMKLHRD